jgi:hypothetical protein
MSSVATLKTFEAGECSAGEWEGGFIRKTGIQEFMERFGKDETVSVFMLDLKLNCEMSSVAASKTFEAGECSAGE